MHVLVSINQTQVRVWINCADYDKQNLAGHINLKVPDGGLIYFRQEPGLKNKLIVSIVYLKVSKEEWVNYRNYSIAFGINSLFYWRSPSYGGLRA